MRFPCDDDRLSPRECIRQDFAYQFFTRKQNVTNLILPSLPPSCKEKGRSAVKEPMKHSLSYRRLHISARSAAFTLVEMLAVIGIIVILTTTTMFSIQRSSGATSRRAAVRTLMGVFDQARMVAISDGRPTYVVFASIPTGQKPDMTALLPTMWGRTYALFEDPVITDSMDPKKFSPVQRSAWLYLPTGVAFKCSTADGTPDNLTAAPPLAGDATKFTVQSRTSNTSVDLVLPYVKFDAVGQIVDYNGNIVDATSACLRVLLFEGGASSSAGSEFYTNNAAVKAVPDSKKYALEEILLKPTTGRAEYTLDPSNNLAVATSTP